MLQLSLCFVCQATIHNVDHMRISDCSAGFTAGKLSDFVDWKMLSPIGLVTVLKIAISLFTKVSVYSIFQNNFLNHICSDFISILLWIFFGRQLLMGFQNVAFLPS